MYLNISYTGTCLDNVLNKTTPFKSLKKQQRTVILATLLYQTLSMLGKSRETKHAHQCDQASYQPLPNYPHFSLHSHLARRLHQTSSQGHLCSCRGGGLTSCLVKTMS
jgi:hypothetical protein